MKSDQSGGGLLAEISRIGVEPWQGGEKWFRREHFESFDETRRGRRKNRRRIH
jgi:hypothetical protein